MKRAQEKKIARRIALLAACIAPSSAFGVIFSNNADPEFNKTAPTDANLLNSGWQWQGNWLGAFSGTPIGTHYFIAAQHTRGAADIGQGFLLNNVSYTTTLFPDGITHFKDIPNTDLQIWHVDTPFPSYAVPWDASVDGVEVDELTPGSGKEVVMIGRGVPRGAEVRVPQPSGTLKGWEWADFGLDPHNRRWGQNKISGYEDFAANNDNRIFVFTFDALNQGDYLNGNEAAVTAGDSGGGTFIKSGNQWKLAGVNYGADSPFSYTAGDPYFFASLTDQGGLWDRSGDFAVPPTPPVLIPDLPMDQPTRSYISRISTSIAALKPYMSPTWNVDADGSWATSGNWSGNLPSGNDAEANFRGVISQARTVSVNSARTAGTIYFDNTNRYTINGSNTLTLNVTSGSAAVNVLSGSHTISTALTLADNTTFTVAPASTLTVSGTVNSTGVAITKSGDGTLEMNNVRATGLTVDGGTLKVLSNGGNAGASRITSLSLTGTGRVDVTNNKLVLDYTGSTPLTTIRSKILAGRNGTDFASGNWNGTTGIMSSTAAAGDLVSFAVGYVENSFLPQLGLPSYTSFGGQSADSNSILIRYTLGADANLDGKVNTDDVTIVGAVYNTAGTGEWYLGDFDYDGICDSDDVTVLGALYDATAPALSESQLSAQFGSEFAAAFEAGRTMAAAVPEPSSLLALAVAGSCALARRSRRRR